MLGARLQLLLPPDNSFSTINPPLSFLVPSSVETQRERFGMSPETRVISRVPGFILKPVPALTRSKFKCLNPIVKQGVETRTHALGASRTPHNNRFDTIELSKSCSEHQQPIFIWSTSCNIGRGKKEDPFKLNQAQ